MHLVAPSEAEQKKCVKVAAIVVVSKCMVGKKRQKGSFIDVPFFSNKNAPTPTPQAHHGVDPTTHMVETNTPS